MTPPDPLTRLRARDPVTWLREQAGADEPPPGAVLARILATPPEPRRPRPRRRLVLAAAVVAVAVIAALAMVLPSDTRVDLAARAYAATAPADAVVFTEEVHETTARRLRPGSQPLPPAQSSVIRMWQRGDRMHNKMWDVQADKEKRWYYEHEQNGDTLRTLNPDGTVDTMRVGDPGWDPEEVRYVFATGRRTIVEQFRARYADAELRELGETTFDGKRAREYEVIARRPPPPDRFPPPMPKQQERFYIDVATGLPLGSRSVLPLRGVKVDPETRKPVHATDEPYGEMIFTQVIKRFEKLPVTAENLALLDAPAIDAGRPNKP